MSNVKKNFFYQSIFQMLSMALPLVTSPILSRSLGAEGVGIFTFVSTIVNYFVLAANLGVYKYGTREIAKVQNEKEERSRVFWEIWTLHFVLLVIIGGIYLGYTYYFADYKVFFFIYFFAYLGSVFSLDWLFAGVEDFKQITIRDSVIKIVSFILIVILVHDKSDLITYFILSAACFFFSSSLYWIMKKKYVSRAKIAYSKIFNHFSGMLILFVPILLESLYHSMDKIMLGVMCPKSEVGYYGNAEKALIAKKFVYTVSIVLMPKMSNLLSKGEKDEFNRLMKQSIGIIIVLSTAFGFGTAAIAKEFSVIFWGADFIYSANLIIVLSLCMPAILISAAIREQYLIASSNEKKYMLAAGVGTVINLIINLALIPYYGALGASIATLISEYVVLLVQIWVVRKELPIISYIHGNEVYFVFGTVMFFVVRAFATSLGIHLYTLLLEVIIGGGTYLIMCLLYWYITHNDLYLGYLRAVIRKRRK